MRKKILLLFMMGALLPGCFLGGCGNKKDRAVETVKVEESKKENTSKEKTEKEKKTGLSEKEKTHKQKNIKLDKNPEPNNNNDSYIRPHTEVLQFTDKTFSKNLKGWAFGESDKPKVKSVIEKDNKKRHSRNGKSSKRDRP